MSREKLQDILLEVKMTLQRIRIENRQAVEIRFRPRAFRWLLNELATQPWLDNAKSAQPYRFMGYPIRIDERLSPSDKGNGYWFWIETIDRLSPPAKG